MEKIFNEIKKINKQDKASHAERLGKLFEEAGELATEINKTNGRKVHSNTNAEIKKGVMLEAADVIQNVFSIIDGFNIKYDDLLDAMRAKNLKWKSKLKKNGK